MAEGLFWVEQPAGGGYQAGDAIAICPDGWPWSERELTHPGWVVTQIQIAPHLLEGWTASLRDAATGRLLLLRQRHLDPTSAIFAFLHARRGRGYPVGLTREQTAALLQARREKPLPGRIVLR